MAASDKALLMNKVYETLKTRMFANLLEEAMDGIQEHLDDFEVERIANDAMETDNLLQAFLDSKRSNGRQEKTLVRYAYVIGRFMTHVKVKTRDVTEEHVREYFASELERGVAKSTVEGIREVLNAYFRWLAEEGSIKRNPLIHVDVVREKKKVKKSFSDVDIVKLRRNCTSLRDSLIVEMLLSTGCRISELVGMNRSDINMATGECIVNGKGDKERTVYINDVAMLALKEYLASRDDDNEAVFINKKKNRLLPGGVRLILNKIAETAGVEHVHPHKFRRTNITMLLNRGMPIQEVAILSGHDEISTTMMYYDSSETRIKNSWQRYSS